MNPINWKRTGSAIMLIAGLCALLTGCSSSPSSGDGERAIQNRINEQSQGRVKLTKFEKSNGAQGEMMGFKIYALEFDAEIEFTEDCKWITGMFGQQLSFQTSKPVAKPGSGFGWNSFLDDTTNPGTLVKKGQQVKLSGVVRFVKKEKGWAVDGVELTKTDLAKADEPSRKEGMPATVDHPVQSEKQPPIDSTDSKRRASAACANNLKQISLAFRMWASDHGDMFPFQISTNGGRDILGEFVKGGTLEFCSRGSDGFDSSAPVIFSVMSNELEKTEILVCPADQKKPAANFGKLSSQNVSYQVRTAKDVDITNPDVILCRCPIHGHEALMDGSVKGGRLPR